MDPLTIIAIVILAYVLSKYFPTTLGGIGLGLPPSNSVVVPPAIVAQSTAGQTIQTEQATLAAANAGLNAIPVVGAALVPLVNVVENALFSASKARAAQATTENAAVALAVPGWDQGVKQVVTLYNAGSLSASQVVGLLQQLMANYFMEVGPKIQPGRNGCQSGAITKAQADQQFPGLDQCSGDWGGACCVGYASLWNSVNNMTYAVNLAANTGKPTPAVVIQVNASKYGGVNRAQYTVVFTPNTTSLGLL